MISGNEWFDQPNELISESEVVEVPHKKEPQLYIVLWNNCTYKVYKDDIYYANSEEEVVSFIMESARVSKITVENNLTIHKIDGIVDLTKELKAHETDNL
jgi:hypothetical protein